MQDAQTKLLSRVKTTKILKLSSNLTLRDLEFLHKTFLSLYNEKVEQENQQDLFDIVPKISHNQKYKPRFLYDINFKIYDRGQ